jgi:hypothetical protein
VNGTALFVAYGFSSSRGVGGSVPGLKALAGAVITIMKVSLAS